MNRSEWNQPVGGNEWIRRAGGRRHYNSHRQCVRLFRRIHIMRWLGANNRSPWEHGIQADVGREFNVSRSTAHRDIQDFIEQARKTRTCPLCGQGDLVYTGPSAGEIKREFADLKKRERWGK